MIIDSQRLDDFLFTLLDDGTYEVGAGSAKLRVATKIVIPSEYNGKPVTRIADNGFRYSGFKKVGYNGQMDKMKELIIPNSITHIGSCAFAGSKSLQSLTIPGSVKTIGDCAFMECPKLKKVDILDGVTYIGNTAFGLCKRLEHVWMTSNVKNWDGIRVFAFRGCPKLKDLVIEDLDT